MTEPARAGRARSTTEMRFAISLAACRHCRTRVDPEALTLRGQGEAWAWNGDCPRCRAPLSFTFRSQGDPVNAPVPIDELGGPAPSQIISPGELLAEIDRLVPLVRPAPSRLALPAWKASRDANDRLLTCALELAKFVPAGAPAIEPGALSASDRADRAARPERYTRAWIDELRQRCLAMRAQLVADLPRVASAAPPPAPAQGDALDRAALRAHEAWVRRGQRGDGRLVLRGVQARGERLGAAELTGAALSQVDFREAELGAAALDDAELIDASFAGAQLTSARFCDARLRGGGFDKAVLALARFERAAIEGTAFIAANLDRSQWQDARVAGARFDRAAFGNAALDRAVFTRTSFVGASFAATSRLPAPTTAGTRFEDCDLRNTRWQDRSLAGAVFLRCKLSGLAGRPASIAGLVIEAADLSPDGDGSDIATLDDVLDAAGWP